jgi:hypothetical protein
VRPHHRATIRSWRLGICAQLIHYAIGRISARQQQDRFRPSLGRKDGFVEWLGAAKLSAADSQEARALKSMEGQDRSNEKRLERKGGRLRNWLKVGADYWLVRCFPMVWDWT